MRYPNFLKEKEKISLIAPSFGCTIEPYLTKLKASIANLKSLDYKISVGNNCFSNSLDEAKSNTSIMCAKEFMDSYDSDSNCIISVGGGELMMEILPYIDFNKIKKLPPKYFMGFSDNTNLTFTLTTLCDIATIYGVNAANLYAPLSYGSLDAINLLTGKKLQFSGYERWEKTSLVSIDEPLHKINLDQEKQIKVFNYTNSVTGRLIGGCLDCLVHLCGTPYDETDKFINKYKNDGFIWYLESCDASLLEYRRQIDQLDMCGWFKYVKCFIIGRPYSCYNDTFMNINHYSAVTSTLLKYDVPIIMDADIGHYNPSLPMLNGSIATISLKNKNIYINYLLK